MTALQLAALAAVAVAGTATVLVRDPVRQLVVAGVLGIALALMFFVFGSPDVALSQIVVGTIAVPTITLLALSRMHEDGEDE